MVHPMTVWITVCKGSKGILDETTTRRQIAGFDPRRVIFSWYHDAVEVEPRIPIISGIPTVVASVPRVERQFPGVALARFGLPIKTSVSTVADEKPVCQT